jgi:hypothetical protein
MKKHRIINIMKLHKNLSYAMREANLTLFVFCVFPGRKRELMNFAILRF